MKAIYIAISSAFLTLSNFAVAEVICVSTAAEMRAAFTSAAASPEATEIRVRRGFYSLPAANAGAVSLTYSATSNLKISGGWDGNANLCTDHFPRAEDTVLSAGSVGRLMSIYIQSGSGTEIDIQKLSFRQAEAPSNVANVAACLTIESDVTSGANIYVERNAFRLCNRPGTASALLVRARSAQVYVRNNLFLDNSSATGAIFLHGLGSSTFYFSNNSIANNPQYAPGGGPGGLQLSGQSSDFTWITNNVLWNNGTGTGYDLLASSGPIVLSNNLIGEIGGTLPSGTVNNNTTSTDPGFLSSVDLRPRNNSPLRDSGISPPGGALAFDFDSNPRVHGPAIDRGAFEYTPLFENGFE